MKDLSKSVKSMKMKEWIRWIKMYMAIRNRFWVVPLSKIKSFLFPTFQLISYPQVLIV